MAAGNITVGRSLAMVESNTTERTVELPGMASLLNVGAAEVFISGNDSVGTTKVQTDGTIFLPVNVPVPLPREMRRFRHKTASGTGLILVIVDTR